MVCFFDVALLAVGTEADVCVSLVGQCVTSTGVAKKRSNTSTPIAELLAILKGKKCRKQMARIVDIPAGYCCCTYYSYFYYYYHHHHQSPWSVQANSRSRPNQPRNFLYFMEPEVSLPCYSQGFQPHPGFYPQLVESSPHPQTLVP
jgi:hypothetical protein